jgi:glucan phosphoethanolaminetransferase (alkaline phosphatase superfamily)
MELYFAVWLVAYALVTIGVIFNIKKKNRKHDLNKITIIAGLILAAALGVILFIAMKIQITNLT